MATLFLYRRGKGAKHRVMHLAAFNRDGEVVGSWCGRKGLNTSCNLPLGRPACKDCIKAHNEASRND